MLERMRTGRRPLKGVLLNYSCERLSLMPLRNSGKWNHPTRRVDVPSSEGTLEHVYPSSHQSSHEASPQEQRQTVSLRRTPRCVKKAQGYKKRGADIENGLVDIAGEGEGTNLGK